MRGKAKSPVSADLVPGITPAYAGKSGKGSGGIGAAEDHPRLCGEKPESPMPSLRCPGSPPPMRGKGRAFALLLLVVRITPAYAGKSHRLPVDTVLCQDHPRLCGEKHTPDLPHTCDQGSPPPMRGKAPVRTEY